ncbi:MAG TPA: polysaccharide pyruvyl transferase family protein [Opitutaceae bacterium]|nr:polysaccharide pyruvyl transferase family protein [Opitutaceae bacterium]
MSFTRRHFIKSTTTALAASAVAAPLARAQRATSRPKRILLRNAWQNVNIGDIGHYLGTLELMEKYYPEAEMTLWPRPRALDGGIREKLLQAFPKVKIAEGTLKDGKPEGAELTEAWEKADFMLHGSGSGFSARTDVLAWHRTTGKPFGVFGTSTDPISGIGADRDPEGGTLANLRSRIQKLPSNHLAEETRWLIDRASFMFCRDTLSRDYLKAQQVKTSVLEFGPDSQFGMKRRDDKTGDAFLKSRGLEEGRFICVIPRLRYTPYYQIRNEPRVPADDIRDAINNRTEDSDHARVRDMIISYVRNTGNKVLACGEMTYQVPLAKKILVDPLPADVKRNVVWRDTFWFTYEAASVFARSQTVVCVDCHSPIIALSHGKPGFYVRQPTDTCKGEMFHDIEISPWTFEVEETRSQHLWSQLEQINKYPSDAHTHIKAVMTKVDALQQNMVDTLRAAVTG